MKDSDAGNRQSTYVNWEQAYEKMHGKQDCASSIELQEQANEGSDDASSEPKGEMHDSSYCCSKECVIL